VENASYGLCSCAERNAVFKAVTEGKRDFLMIAIMIKDGGFSCGACRQVLNEFSPNIHLIIVNGEGKIIAESNLVIELGSHFFQGS
jgi:cytidine deaminase